MALPIKTIHTETLAMAAELNIPVNPDTLLALIKTTRAKSDIVLAHPDFNPSLIVTGCNARATLNYYHQMVNLASPTFSPEKELVALLPEPPAEILLDVPAPAKKGGLKKKTK